VKKVSVLEAKTHLSRLIVSACDGEDVVISRAGKPVVRLVPIRHEKQERRFGAMKGKARVTRTFFEPLPPELLDGWEGR
jgi:prevent-host-death family protein